MADTDLAAAAPKRLSVAISYAPEGDEYREEVERLATQLTRDGLTVALQPRDAGDDAVAEFMSRELRYADRVLILCSPGYRRRAQALSDGLAARAGDAGIVSHTSHYDLRGKVCVAIGQGRRKAATPPYLRRYHAVDLSSPKKRNHNYSDLFEELTGEPPSGWPRRASTSVSDGLLPFLMVLVFIAARTIDARAASLEARAALDGLQAGLILFLGANLSGSAPSVLRSRDHEVNVRLREFHRHWQMLWFLWFLMYLLYAYLGWRPPTELRRANFAANVLNDLQSLAFILLYRDLSTAATRKRAYDPVIVGLVIAAIAAGEMWALLRQDTTVSIVMATVSGLIATGSMALFASRLESKYLDCGWLFLIALFVYSGAQLLYPILRTDPSVPMGSTAKPLFEGADSLIAGLKVYAMGMKLSLFVVIGRLLSRGRIAFMIDELHLDDKESTLDHRWKTFREETRRDRWD